MPSKSVIQTISRRTHYVDIENLCCEAIPNKSLVHHAMSEYAAACAQLKTERLTVACNHKVAQTVAFGLQLSGAQLRMGSGRDGADLALIDVLLDDLRFGRVSEVVLGSGDGIFADAMQPIRNSIEKLTVVAREGTISDRLMVIADEVLLLPSFSETYSSSYRKAA
jgi:hypothetical protein